MPDCIERPEKAGPRAAEAALIRVPGDYPTIQEAIDAAADGDTVVVSPGVYHENINFNGREIILRGADPGDPQAVASTVIRGAGGGAVVVFEHGEGAGAVLAGFTVSGGSGSPVAEQHGYFGGGILISNGSAPLVKKNIIRDNEAGDGGSSRAPGFGGGIAVLNASPCIVQNTIVNNGAASEGGGIFIRASEPVIEGNLVGGNRARVGGGIAADGQSDFLVAGNTIEENSAIEGGGINLTDSRAEILDNRITGNSASVYGGGISVWRSRPVIAGNIFEQNNARIKGGAICLSRDSLVSLNTRWVNTFRRNRPDRLFYQPSEFS